MLDRSPVSRRDWLKSAGALSALALGIGTGGCESCRRRIENRPTRRNIATMAANDPVIDAYKAAVSAMKALPASDRRNWERQATIHFDFCPHGNWWFLPWHRVYLFYFERICRKLSGYEDFALPYWNWTTHPNIPAAFWGGGNPLFEPRTATPASTASASMVGPGTIGDILDLTNFFLFASAQAVGQRDPAGYGELEATPHNYIHGFVGGIMGSYRSPRDPVFWTHHNMIECLWVNWNLLRGNPNTNEAAWMDHQFTEFADEDGNPVTVNVATSLLYPLFSYQFEPCAPVDHPQTLDRNALEKFLREGAPSSLEFTRRFPVAPAVVTEVGKPAIHRVPLERGAFASLRDAAAGNAAVLTIGGVDAPDRADYFVRVFINKDDATEATPIDDPHYAGSFAFFSDSAAMKDHAHPRPGFLVDVTPTIRRLDQGGGLDAAPLGITLVPVPFEGRSAPGQRLGVERLELGLARVRPPAP
jgi:tyrosinase